MFEKFLAKRHIASLDFSPIRLKVIEHHGWSSDKTDQVELEYRRFLYALAHKRNEYSISPPTLEVDQFWHQHILNTKKYREDCDKVFGRYIDHTPGLSPEQQAEADARRRQVYSDNGIDAIEFDSGDSSSGHTATADPASNGHHSHGSHFFDGTHHGDGHAGDSHGSDSGGHGTGDSSGGDSGGDGGGGDGGGGDGGGCGGGSCGGGCGG